MPLHAASAKIIMENSPWAGIVHGGNQTPRSLTLTRVMSWPFHLLVQGSIFQLHVNIVFFLLVFFSKAENTGEPNILHSLEKNIIRQKGCFSLHQSENQSREKSCPQDPNFYSYKHMKVLPKL